MLVYIFLVRIFINDYFEMKFPLNQYVVTIGFVDYINECRLGATMSTKVWNTGWWQMRRRRDSPPLTSFVHLKTQLQKVVVFTEVLALESLRNKQLRMLRSLAIKQGFPDSLYQITESEVINVFFADRARRRD